MTVDDLVAHAHRHRFCITAAYNRREYARSPGYAIVDEEGNPDPNGSWVRRPSGKLIPLEGHCDHPEESCLARVVKDPDTEVIPAPKEADFVEVDVFARLEELLALQSRN